MQTGERSFDKVVLLSEDWWERFILHGFCASSEWLMWHHKGIKASSTRAMQVSGDCTNKLLRSYDSQGHSQLSWIKLVADRLPWHSTQRVPDGSDQSNDSLWCVIVLPVIVGLILTVRLSSCQRGYLFMSLILNRKTRGSNKSQIRKTNKDRQTWNRSM